MTSLVSAQVLESILEDAGHEVITESNGRQALQRANKRRPDLVLLDFMMPIMGGLSGARGNAGRPRALLTLYHDRFSQQMETAHSETILAAWL